MTKNQNPLREIASNTKFNVDGGSANLVMNNIYSVEDIVKPILTYDPTVGDPRLYVSEGNRRSKIKWRKVNRNGWISPKHQAQGDQDTVIQIKFAKPKKLNRISFELLRVPQIWNVKYYDQVRKQMVSLTDRRGKKLAGSVSGFAVNVLDPKKEKDTSHKWRGFDYDLPTIRTNLIEIHLNRDIQNPPIEHLDDFFGMPKNTPYSVGIRNLKLKMKILDDDDVDDGGDDDGGPGPIGTSERAVIKRHTSIMAHDGGEATYWECAPQGAASSVVPYYIDMRQSDGSASIFDTLKLIPLWPGPSMSMYYSNDDTALPWTLSPNRVMLDTKGDISPGFVKGSGLFVDQADSVYAVSNSYLRFSVPNSFVSGLHWTPTFTNSGNDRWLWNFLQYDSEGSPGNQLGLIFRPSASGASTITGQFKVQQNVTTTLATFSSSYTFDINKTYAIVVGYNQNNLDLDHPKGWYLDVSVVPGVSSTSTTQYTVGTAPAALWPQALRIGNKADKTRPARGYISHLWFKLDGYTHLAANAFLLSSDSFIAGEGNPDQRTNGHYNSIFASKLTKSLEVRVGPGAGYFRSKKWTPIPVDYTLSSTQYQLPVTEAKFLKLEFSNLVARTYLTDLEELPVTDFPSWIKDWYRSISTQRQGVPYNAIQNSRNFYEGVPTPVTPGDQRQHTRVRELLDGGGSGGMPPIVYHTDQATAEAAVNPRLFDRVGLYKELQFAAIPMRFMETGRHEYTTHTVNVERRAFFVGIKELQVFRSDYTVVMDNPEYGDTFEDNQHIQDVGTWVNVGSSMQAGNTGSVMITKTFESFSKFNTIQVAVLDSPWESPMTIDQIDLGDVTHLTDPQGVAFDSSTSTLRTFVTGQYQGARGGNVVQLSRAGTAEYGLKTKTGMFVGFAIDQYGARTSAVVRMQLPQTNLGTYELRLYESGNLVAVKPIKISSKSWQEIELAYVANAADFDWQAEVVQTDPTISEPFVVDMLGIWQHPVRWEFSNDGGLTYQTALWPMNKPNGYIRFNQAGSKLKVRITAMRNNAVVSGWTVVPWYIESPMVARAPIDLNPPWGISDSDALRDTSHKPIFRLWNHWFPQSYSVNLYGYW